MLRTISVLLGGLVLGVGAAYFWFGTGPSKAGTQQAEIVRDIADTPKMSVAAADQHRRDRYQEMQSIEAIYALPSAFARSEALFALAGRSDSAKLQGLIFDANRIADTLDRQGALGVLFFRLTELDAQSALVLARTKFFEGEKSIEQTVWRTWAKADLEEAISAASEQTSTAHKNIAAQALFSVFDFMGNETTDRIEAQLGIGPDRSTRSRFLYRMADRSPADTIDYINNMPKSTQQTEFVSWLAYYLSLFDSAVALTYAEQFANDNHKKRYRNIVASNAARENPHSTVERLLANGSGSSRRRSSEFSSAVNALVESDLDSALQYFAQVHSVEDRQVFGAAIVDRMARTDPSQALAWARVNEGKEYPYLEMSVLSQIAQTDPQLAIAEAQAVDNVEFRSQLLSSVISGLARRDPLEALPFLDQIKTKQQRENAEQQLASTWMREDPDAAIDWIMSNDADTAARILESTSWSIMRSDLDVAIRLLPKLDEQQQIHWRMQITQQLTTRRSPAEAQSFVSQFKGQDGYAQLQASVISGVAKTDPLRAKQMADELADTAARDTAYAQIIGTRAQTNPVEAVSWLRNISSEHHRSTATMQLVQQWYQTDPDAVSHWLTGLQRGSMRDDAVMYMANFWRTPTLEQEAMIDSISDPDKRGQAKVRQIYNVVRTNPAKARELLEKADIPSYQRQQVEVFLSQYYGGG